MKSTQASRLAELRRQSGLTQVEVGEKVGVSDARISTYEKDDSVRIKMPVLRKLAELYQTTTEFIEKGIRTAKEPFNPMPPRVLISNNSVDDRILLVPEKAEAGYRKHFSDEEYLGTLPLYSIPGFENGNFRMFTVSGDSMLPLFLPGDILICEHVEKAADIKDREIYVLVTVEGICVKRVTNRAVTRSALLIESENPSYGPDFVPVGEVLELWKYRKKLTY
jgi:transcriptional regulator with XRE-family HTH domain